MIADFSKSRYINVLKAPLEMEQINIVTATGIRNSNEVLGDRKTRTMHTKMRPCFDDAMHNRVDKDVFTAALQKPLLYKHSIDHV